MIVEDKNALFSRGIFIEKMTPIGRLSNLVNKLWPVKTKFPLIRIGSENDGGYFSALAHAFLLGWMLMQALKRS